jgi:hypothetical protein
MADSSLQNVRIALRNDTAAKWAEVDPVLLKGEIGIEIDTRKFKFGDGVTKYSELAYASADDAMLLSVFATNDKASNGYVDKAVKADSADTATTADKVANALTAGDKTFDGSSAVTITASDLGAITEIPSTYIQDSDIATETKVGVVKSTAKGTDTVTVNADGTMTIGKASVAAKADEATKAGSADTAGEADNAKKTTGTLTAGDKTFNGSEDVSITASDLGALTEIPDTYVKFENIATAGKAGVVKSVTKGTDTVTVNDDGTMTIGKASAAVKADEASKVTNALTAGGKTFDGSAAVEITASDLGALTAIPDTYVENTDYATADVAGVVKSVAKGTDTVTVNADGTMTMGKASTAVKADEATKAETADSATSAEAAAKLSTARDIALSGDVTGSASFDGSANTTIAATLADSGVNAGTYTKVTVDAKGRVTVGDNLAVADIPDLTLSKITDAGTAAAKNVGTASGNVPVLDANGKLDTAVLPAIAITEVFEADSESAMLALTAQTGDVCVRSDINKSFILKADDATVADNWVELKTPTDAVLSVNGKTGTVTLTTTDVAEGTNLYYTEDRATANFKTHASTDLTDSDSLVRTTDTLVISCGNA